MHCTILSFILCQLICYLCIFSQLGSNSCSVGGRHLSKGENASLGPGGTFCLLGNSYHYFIHFCILSSVDEASDEPKAKKSRCDAMSDSEEDENSSGDLEEIRLEFGEDMVWKMKGKGKVLTDSTTSSEAVDKEDGSSSVKGLWEEIGGKLIIFNSKGVEGRSKVMLLKEDSCQTFTDKHF